ncbi:MAG: putative heme transporter, partial [Cryptosporangiaceae bacterium]|nr:putative heme transporter [Cryptosporangiaceae bacterium]
MLMVEPSEPSIDEGVPRGVRVAAAWAWRVLILGAVGYLLFKVFGMLSLLMIPVGISLLLAAMLSPGVSWLVRHGLPKPLAVVMVMIGGLAAVAGVLTIVIQAFVAGLG